MSERAKMKAEGTYADGTEARVRASIGTLDEYLECMMVAAKRMPCRTCGKPSRSALVAVVHDGEAYRADVTPGFCARHAKVRS
jgi:hypothetical protein